MTQGPPSIPPQRPRPAMPTLVDSDETVNIPGVVGRGADRAVLTQMDGLEAGRVCGLDGPDVTLGRAPTCTHAFDEASLSRVHARVVKEGGQHVVVDEGSRNGVFVNGDRVKRCVLRDGDRVRLGSVITLRFQRVDEQEEKALVRVYESSVKDGLTGVWNRKYLDERIRGELAFATRHKSPLSVLMVDIDHFKKVNDTWGHLAGDEVLKATAAAMKGAIRVEDLIARYGGEVFLVLARGADLKSATQLGERLRQIAERRPVVVSGTTISRTVSVGVASIACVGAGVTIESLVGLADERLYRAKEGGRNRVIGG
jgi:two-component system cell cycle response regulator